MKPHASAHSDLFTNAEVK